MFSAASSRRSSRPIDARHAADPLLDVVHHADELVDDHVQLREDVARLLEQPDDLGEVLVRVQHELGALLQVLRIFAGFSSGGMGAKLRFSRDAAPQPPSAADAAAEARARRVAARRAEGLDGTPVPGARSGTGLHVPAVSPSGGAHVRARRRVADEEGSPATPLARRVLDVRRPRRDRPLPLGLTSLPIGNRRVTVTHGLPSDAGDHGRPDDGGRSSSVCVTDAKPVGELARGLPVSRPAVSKHLRLMKEAGVVRMTEDGTRNLYELDLRSIEQVRRYLDGFWDVAPRAVQGRSGEANGQSGEEPNDER